MTISRTINKQLAGREDLLLGNGTQTQTRGGIDVSISKINALSIPYYPNGSSTSTPVGTTLDRLDGIDGVAALKALTPIDGETYWLNYHTTEGDGGGGRFRAYTGESAGTYTDDNGVTILPVGGDGSAAWVREYSGPVDVRWFGATGDGSTDDTDAIQAAINTADGKNKNVCLPAGTYKVTQTLTINSGSIGLIGDSGRTATILHSGDYGDTISLTRITPLTNRISFVSIINLRFFVDSSATLPTSGAHLHFVRPQACEVRGCDISEHFGGIHFEGGAGVVISDTKINSGQFYSTLKVNSYLAKFVGVETSGSREFPSEYTVNNFNWRDSGNAYIQYGIVIDSSDGLFFSNGHVGFTNSSCCLIKPSVAADSLNGINFNNTHFDGNHTTTNGVVYEEPSLGFHLGVCFGHTYTGCQFSICTGNGFKVDIDSMTGLSITGGRSNANDTWGIRLSRGSGMVVAGMVMSTNGTNVAGTGHILVENDVTDVDISGIFTATTYRGVQIIGTADRIKVDGIFNGTTAEDVITSSLGINNKISGITNKSNVIASAATITLPLLGNHYEISGSTNITSIVGSSRYEGKIITLKFQGSLTVTDGSNLVLAGDFVTSANDMIMLVSYGSSWHEISRSTN